ncbi:helix-turn-helix domain-containing protein [Rhizobium rosettiformans]|uniref:Helix-turn-helix domain-containing protein n=1 Tax=Rhizobium rosettiformans TaxID=1368430 RepID=A0ABX7EWQ6_9HYPH|nr:helix-turn-helix domain-containing protein [Rhizobium rosettiformans]QRF51663.1 helix-turn-helix domain-containing protein [Rhizobium rosettiformans]
MAKLLCTHCGQPMGDFSGIDVAKLTRNEMLIVEALVQANHRLTSIGVLIEKVWGDCPDGGPLSAPIAVRGHICTARKKLEKAGWTIRAQKGHGYRLERLDAGKAVA